MGHCRGAVGRYSVASASVCSMQTRGTPVRRSSHGAFASCGRRGNADCVGRPQRNAPPRDQFEQWDLRAEVRIDLLPTLHSVSQRRVCLFQPTGAASVFNPKRKYGYPRSEWALQLWSMPCIGHLRRVCMVERETLSVDAKVEHNDHLKVEPARRTRRRSASRLRDATA